MSKADEIKIIDLLNNIANGEEVPKRIKVQNYIWTYEENFKQYKNDDFQELVKYLLGYYQKEGCCFTVYGALNCEVELIEDQTIDIDSIAGMVIRHYQTPEEKETYIQSKINELVQAVKHLNKEIQSIKEK